MPYPEASLLLLWRRARPVEPSGLLAGRGLAVIGPASPLPLSCHLQSDEEVASLSGA